MENRNQYLAKLKFNEVSKTFKFSKFSLQSKPKSFSFDLVKKSNKSA